METETPTIEQDRVSGIRPTLAELVALRAPVAHLLTRSELDAALKIAEHIDRARGIASLPQD